ncbi:MAG TPA: hypothetical protein VK493_02355 [Bryobacteraceae bacterium]|nr:hypothetical protein [Bryobacteraceae bacterium]
MAIQRFRLALLQQPFQIAERHAAVDNILDDQNVVALDIDIQVARDFYLSGTRLLMAVGRNGHELNPHGRPRDGARQVGYKHESALQDGHQIDRPLRIVALDFRRHFSDAPLDLI